MERLEDRIYEVKASRNRHAPAANVTSRYLESTFADKVIGIRSRYADLVVLGPELLGGDTLKTRAIKGVLFSSGRPLLMIPPNARPTLQPRQVIVAWNSSLEASNAVHSTLGILKKAQQVRIVMVDPVAEETGNGVDPGHDLAAFLCRHGVNATMDRLPSMGKKVEEILRRHVVDTAADLLVMGAYGHSRFREQIFGGVTRSMLEEAPIAVLVGR